ncbi:MAG: serine/threonine protein kinase [Micropruina sp.]|nr:serine/threonine protein kinase [Micropruina sp.]
MVAQLHHVDPGTQNACGERAQIVRIASRIGDAQQPSESQPHINSPQYRHGRQPNTDPDPGEGPQPRPIPIQIEPAGRSGRGASCDLDSPAGLDGLTSPDLSGATVTTVSTSDPLVGQLLDGRYAISRKLARGGMATVYLADDQRLTRTVAVKVMHEGLGDDQDFIGKFDREARAAARLSHPNVVSVFDQGLHRGRPYIVMEYVEGCTLRHMITREGSFSPERALELLIPVTSAVAAAHESGMIHRDIKPENILISDRGQIKVADFGLARAVSAQTATATGMLIGTVSYIAPELVTHGKADPRCDVYALGVVLYEMLTGTKPHTGDNPIQVAYAHVHKAIPAPSSAVKTSWRESRNGIPPYLDALVTSAAARRPSDRPTDARVLLDHLRQAREALDRGVMDDPALTARMQRPTLDPENHITEPVPLREDGEQRTPTLRFTPSTPVSPGFPEITDGMPYYDGPVQQPAAPARPRRRWVGLIAGLLAVLLVGSGLWWVFAGQYTATPCWPNSTRPRPRPRPTRPACRSRSTTRTQKTCRPDSSRTPIRLPVSASCTGAPSRPSSPRAPSGTWCRRCAGSTCRPQPRT